MAVLEAHTGRGEVGHTSTGADGFVTAVRIKGTLRTSGWTPGSRTSARAAGSPTSTVSECLSRSGTNKTASAASSAATLATIVGRSTRTRPVPLAFDKSVNLYQSLPSPTAGSRGQVVVVEGTLDAMAIAVAAVRSGTAGRFCPLTQSGRELSAYQLDHVLDLHPFRW